MIRRSTHASGAFGIEAKDGQRTVTVWLCGCGRDCERGNGAHGTRAAARTCRRQAKDRKTEREMHAEESRAYFVDLAAHLED